MPGQHATHIGVAVQRGVVQPVHLCRHGIPDRAHGAAQQQVIAHSPAQAVTAADPLQRVLTGVAGQRVGPGTAGQPQVGRGDGRFGRRRLRWRDGQVCQVAQIVDVQVADAQRASVGGGQDHPFGADAQFAPGCRGDERQRVQRVEPAQVAHVQLVDAHLEVGDHVDCAIGAQHEDVLPRTAVQRIAPRPVNQDVVARPAPDVIGPGAAEDLVAPGRAGRGLAAIGQLPRHADGAQFGAQMADPARRTAARHEQVQPRRTGPHRQCRRIGQRRGDPVGQRGQVHQPPVGQQRHQRNPVIRSARCDKNLPVHLYHGQRRDTGKARAQFVQHLIAQHEGTVGHYLDHRQRAAARRPHQHKGPVPHRHRVQHGALGDRKATARLQPCAPHQLPRSTDLHHVQVVLFTGQRQHKGLRPARDCDHRGDVARAAGGASGIDAAGLHDAGQVGGACPFPHIKALGQPVRHEDIGVLIHRRDGRCHGGGTFDAGTALDQVLRRAGDTAGADGKGLDLGSLTPQGQQARTARHRGQVQLAGRVHATAGGERRLPLQCQPIQRIKRQDPATLGACTVQPQPCGGVAQHQIGQRNQIATGCCKAGRDIAKCDHACLRSRSSCVGLTLVGPGGGGGGSSGQRRGLCRQDNSKPADRGGPAPFGLR